MDELALITLVVAAITLVGVYRSLKAPKGLPLPPGPPGLPIIGNVLDLPKNQEWVQYRNWGRKYGVFAPLLLISCVSLKLLPNFRRHYLSQFTGATSDCLEHCRDSIGVDGQARR